jgi:multisubunit Na+/H+ antiporter MnhE subunit
MTRALIAAILLAALFLLMLPELHVSDIALALTFAIAILLLSVRRGWLVRGGSGRGSFAKVRACVLLLLELLRQSAAGSWQVARLTLGIGKPPLPGNVTLPFGERTARGAAVNGMLITLAPGTLLVALDEDERVMHFHVAGVDRAAFVRSAERMYEHQKVLLP